MLSVIVVVVFPITFDRIFQIRRFNACHCALIAMPRKQFQTKRTVLVFFFLFSFLSPVIAYAVRARFRGAITQRITLEYLVYTFYGYTYIFKSQKTNIFPSCVKSSLRIKNNDEGLVDPEIQRRKYRTLQNVATPENSAQN